MRTRKSCSIETSRRAAILMALLLLVAPISACDSSSLLQSVGGLIESFLPSTTNIAGSVASTTTETGLPESLTGTLSGKFTGTYQEVILEVYLDAEGNPLAALSRSTFTVDAPNEGTITSLNLIVVVEPVLQTDESGQQVAGGTPIGLVTSATGEIIHSTGAFANSVGQLYTDSTVLFGGGDFGLGTLESVMQLELSQ